MHTPDCPVLTVENLSLDLSGRQILRDINLTVARGEFLGLIGPNGGGKTSLLRVLLGIFAPSCGHVRWSDPACGMPRIGYVPQRGGMDRNYPLCAREIVKQGVPGAFPLFGSRRREVNRKASDLLRRVGMAGHEDAFFANLSGGQQRRLLLARALMNDPNVLLLDEPTAGVDSQGQEQFCELLSDLSRQHIAIILVSHDIPLITAHADRIACLCVGLHWHGAAKALDQRIIHEAYQCELERYQVFRDNKPAHVNPVDGHSCRANHPSN
jgi:ABC-type Mn2+/Zn2+ transport system ATPase subunit